MLTFESVYLSAHPAKTLEMLKYIQTVRMGVSRGAMSWQEYDMQYRLRKEQNPASSWGEVDTELWLMYMTPGFSCNTSLSAPSKPNFGKCYNYNFKGSCDKYPCMYKHSCLRCGNLHSMLHCTSVANSAQPQTFRPQGAPNQQYSQPTFRTPNANTTANLRGHPNNNQRPGSRPRFRAPQPMAPRYNTY